MVKFEEGKSVYKHHTFYLGKTEENGKLFLDESIFCIYISH